jgi:putative acetyltransferase
MPHEPVHPEPLPVERVASEPLPIVIRPEREGDAEAVRRVLLAAFTTSDEADLVDALRKEAGPYTALVAHVGDALVGHVAFTPLTVGGAPSPALGLAPLAVLPEYQRRGIGGRLVRAGLEAVRAQGAPFVALVGHSDYYPRFGFEPSRRPSEAVAQSPDGIDTPSRNRSMTSSSPSGGTASPNR